MNTSFVRFAKLLVVPAAFSIAPMLVAQQTPDLGPYLIADRAAEIALARTAAPANVSDSATILVIARTGFVEAVHGTNGFTCFVLRSFDAAVGDPNFWNPTLRAPHCLNPPATRTILPEMSKRVEWIMTGVSTAEIESRTARAYASHEFPAPEVGAMAYMLSPKQVLDVQNSHWLPHLMFYYPRTLPAQIFGGGGFKDPIVNASQGDPTSPLLTLFIPVGRWSDGSSATGHGN